ELRTTPDALPRRSILRQVSVSLLLVCMLAVLPFAGCDGGDSMAAAASRGGGNRTGKGGDAGRGGRGEKRLPGEGLPSRDVRLTRAETGKLPRTVAVSGTLAADEQAELGFKAAGRIGTIAVDLGRAVSRGQVIARLVPTDFQLKVSQSQNALEQARAQLGLPPGGPDRVVDPAETSLVKQAAATLKAARLTRDRMARLFSDQLIPQSDLDAAEANLGVAEGRYQASIEDAR